MVKGYRSGDIDLKIEEKGPFETQLGDTIDWTEASILHKEVRTVFSKGDTRVASLGA